MLRHALRRLLWIVPILIGVTLASFALLSYVPDPADDPALLGTLSAEQAVELRRSRFLDLPRFFNEEPLDVVGRVERALGDLGAGDERAARGRAELVRLGGAALPYLLPRLDALSPAARAQIAVALSPVAERMGIVSSEALDPRQAVAFWNRFWTDRAVDFRAANARRAVRRLSQHGTSSREADLVELDTFALEQIMALLDELASPPSSSEKEGSTVAERVGAIRRLVGAAAHVTGRDDQVAANAGETEALGCIRRWREWWLVHRADYTAQTGASRFASMLTETQYVRWAERAVVLGFGTGSDGSPVLERMGERAPPTLIIMSSALLLAYALSLALAVLGTLRSRARADAWILLASLVVFAVPTACLAIWSVRRAGADQLEWAVFVLALSMVASPFAQSRALLGEVMRRDHIRAARALGFGPLRIITGHALRHALLPVAALASVEMPLALGGTFVVEKVFGIPGLGEETVRAVQTHDVAWLVGLALMTALTVTVTSIAADFAAVAVDPRLSFATLRNRRMSA